MFDSVRLRRLEWLRFAIACSVVAVMLVQMVALFAFGFYSMWLWLSIVAVQVVALQWATVLVNRERKVAIDAWIAARQGAFRRAAPPSG